MKLKEFKCAGCGSVDMLTGGTCNHHCNPCKVAMGLTPGRSPQQEAHLLVARAIRMGDLQPPRLFACLDCGVAASEYDHRDYSAPLAVDPVCRLCNRRRGPAAGHITKRRAPGALIKLHASKKREIKRLLTATEAKAS